MRREIIIAAVAIAGAVTAAYRLLLAARAGDPDRIATWGSLFSGWLLLMVLALSGCGGGGPATAEEIAQHDADVQALALQHDKTILPVSCASGACK